MHVSVLLCNFSYFPYVFQAETLILIAPVPDHLFPFYSFDQRMRYCVKHQISDRLTAGEA